MVSKKAEIVVFVYSYCNGNGSININKKQCIEHNSCGALTASDINTKVTLAGWVQKSRDKGFMIWIDLRDRYGLTQLIFDEERTAANLMDIRQKFRT